MTRITELNIEVLPFPDITIEKVARRAVKKRRPFRDSGTGFIDALVWECVLNCLRVDPELVIFVTRDGDFWNRDSLHPDLVADVSAIDGGSCHFEAHREIEHLVAAVPELQTREAAQLIRDEISTSFAQLEFRGFDLSDAVGLAIQDKLSGQELDPGTVGLPIEFESPTLEGVEGLSDVEVASVSVIDEGDETYLVNLSVTADCEFWGVMFKSDAYGADDMSIHIDTFDWNRTHSMVTASRTVRINGNVYFRIDDQSVLEIEVDDIESAEPDY